MFYMRRILRCRILFSLCGIWATRGLVYEWVGNLHKYLCQRPTNNKNKLLAARIPIENNPDRNSVAGETKFWYTVYK